MTLPVALIIAGFVIAILVSPSMGVVLAVVGCLLLLVGAIR